MIIGLNLVALLHSFEYVKESLIKSNRNENIELSKQIARKLKKMKPLSFASLAYEYKKKHTKQDKFLNEMDQVVPWTRIIGLIELHYPTAGKGRMPMPLESMHRSAELELGHSMGKPLTDSFVRVIKQPLVIKLMSTNSIKSPHDKQASIGPLWKKPNRRENLPHHSVIAIKEMVQ